MQTIRLRSHVDARGNVQLQLPTQLANQEIDLILVYQPTDSPTNESLFPDIEDPLVGLCSGSPSLASESEAIVEQNVVLHAVENTSKPYRAAYV